MSQTSSSLTNENGLIRQKHMKKLSNQFIGRSEYNVVQLQL